MDRLMPLASGAGRDEFGLLMQASQWECSHGVLHYAKGQSTRTADKVADEVPWQCEGVISVVFACSTVHIVCC